MIAGFAFYLYSMITYNTKDWWKFIFTFHKSDTIRKLYPAIIVIVLFTWGVAYFELQYLQLSEKSYVKNIGMMYSLLSFVISMLLVFGTNTAYERWWEGRKLWGSLVNCSRNLAIKLNAMLSHDNKADRAFFKNSIPLYAVVLSHHLRSETTRLALDENEHPELQTFTDV